MALSFSFIIMTLPAFRVSTKDVVFEYRPIKNTENFYVKSWVDNKEQPIKIISPKEAQMSYDYCSSMWIDFGFEVI